MILFLSCPLFSDLLYLLSSDESYFLDDESEDDGSDSGASGTCDFPFCFYNSIGRVSSVGSDVFVPIGVESNYEVVMFVVFVPIGVKSKGG